MPTNNAPTLIAAHTGGTDQFHEHFYLKFLSPLPDGSLIGQGPISIVRLNADGTVRSETTSTPSFAMSSGGNFVTANAQGFKLMPDGKIIFGGSWDTYPDKTPSGYVVYRVNPDGSLDKTFGKGQGWMTTNPGDVEYAAGTLVTKEGRILVVGTSGTGPFLDQPNNFISMSRFTAKGEVDLTFGDKGSVLIQDDDVYLTTVRMQSDGKIVAAGWHHYGQWHESVVYRFNADGTPDASFGKGGVVNLAFESAVSSVDAFAIQPDGKIVTVSSARTKDYNSVYGVTRLNADGTLDAEFGVNGTTMAYPVAPLTPEEQQQGIYVHPRAGSVVVRDDGSIVIGGALDWSDNSKRGMEFSLVSLRPNGALDTGFGNDGRATTPSLPGDHFFAENLVEMPDGRLFITGSGGAKHSVVIYSFNADGTPDLAFGNAGSGTENQITYKEGYAAIALNSGIIVHDAELAGASYQGASLQLQRHGGADKEDVFEGKGKLTLSDGKVLVGGIDIGTAIAGAGTLRIDFNANASESLVNHALHGIAYRNTSDITQDKAVKIDWIFNDGGLGSEPAQTAQATTEVKLVAGNVPAWIAQLLGARDAASLKNDVLAYLDPDHRLNIRYVADGAAVPLTQGDQELMNGLLNNLAAVADIKLGTDATLGSGKLEIHSSPEIAAGKSAYAELAGSGADLYVGKPTTLIRGMLPELNQHLLQALGLQGDTIASAKLDPAHIAALQYLYGPSTTVRTGDDSYKLSTYISNFLWDGKGTDTINGSALTQDLTLHLEAGHWDYIGSKGSSITGAGQITVNFGSAFENALGGSGNDRLYGTSGSNDLRGGAGNDMFEGFGGEDIIDGGTGFDTVTFAGKRAAYQISATEKGFTVTSNESLDQVTGVERLHFANGNVALDIDGNAGQLYRLYQAIFNRKPDAAGLGFWLDAVDRGTSMEAVALSFTQSAEFAKMYGAAPSNKDLLTKVYEYALHRKPDNDGFLWWLDVMDNQKASLGSVLFGFSESKENYAQVIGSMQNGIDYIPFHG